MLNLVKRKIPTHDPVISAADAVLNYIHISAHISPSFTNHTMRTCEQQEVRMGWKGKKELNRFLMGKLI
jgi:hypothetical protein